MRKSIGILLVVSLVLSLSIFVVAEDEHTGAWVDEVIITREGSRGAAIQKLESGDIDIYGHDILDPELFNRLESNPDIDYKMVTGGSSEFLFNISGPV